MTKDEALKLAIEAIELSHDYICDNINEESQRITNNSARHQQYLNHLEKDLHKCDQAIQACKEALEQSAQDFFEKGKEIAKWADKQNEQPAQEPVGKWESKCKCDFRTKLVGDGCKYCNTEEYICKLHSDYDYLLEENEQLLTHPVPSWQGLSDDEIIYMYFEANISPQPHESIIYFIRAIEQALRNKNE